MLVTLKTWELISFNKKYNDFSSLQCKNTYSVGISFYLQRSKYTKEVKVLSFPVILTYQDITFCSVYFHVKCVAWVKLGQIIGFGEIHWDTGSAVKSGAVPGELGHLVTLEVATSWCWETSLAYCIFFIIIWHSSVFFLRFMRRFGCCFPQRISSTLKKTLL